MGDVMKKPMIVLAVLGLAWNFEQPVRAQKVPSAIVADPSPDKEVPAELAILTIPSHGVDLDAFFYLAAGSTRHGVVLLLHGLPGYEINADLAQSIRRAGWNVLIFHYRGTWGTAGAFSQASALEDAAEAI